MAIWERTTTHFNHDFSHTGYLDTTRTTNMKGRKADMSERPITVFFPHVLRPKIGNRSSITTTGSTIQEIINALEREYPGIRFNLCYETGELRPYVNIFLERENIRYLQLLETPVPAGATIHILQSVAGG